ncbi:MAG: hypothetical protein AB1472_02345 [Candidatus Omnitrophota bacterium]
MEEKKSFWSIVNIIRILIILFVVTPYLIRFFPLFLLDVVSICMRTGGNLTGIGLILGLPGIVLLFFLIPKKSE